ncbi:MAG: hypothetical protein II630_00010, partial [Bacteroidales bacterium]|nr:hypothetical protein [Bacteroidales bacterium]
IINSTPGINAGDDISDSNPTEDVDYEILDEHNNGNVEEQKRIQQPTADEKKEQKAPAEQKTQPVNGEVPSPQNDDEDF